MDIQKIPPNIGYPKIDFWISINQVDFMISIIQLMDIQKLAVFVFVFVKGLPPHFNWRQLNIYTHPVVIFLKLTENYTRNVWLGEGQGRAGQGRAIVVG